MATALLPVTTSAFSLDVPLPALGLHAGEKAAWQFIEFLTATIRNPHTKEAYFRIVTNFLTWCER